MKSDNCRGCQSAKLVALHDFGAQPLAGNYPTHPESVQPAKRYPLDLTLCADCTLLQVVNLPPIEEVFHSDYRYSSSTVPGLVKHFVAYADWLRNILWAGARVFEFGCNDGVLLERLRGPGIECAGIDASENVAALARAKGLDVVTGFLTEEYVRGANAIEYFDLVTCSNVFAHIHELRNTLRAVKLLLKPRGLFAIEVHDGELLVKDKQFDTIYHEHLTYFTEETLRFLLERHDFEFVMCERTSMHGGGLRMLARKSAQRRVQASRTLAAHEEIKPGFLDPSLERCRRQVRELYERHGLLVGYGAAGRAQMFINLTQTARYFSRVYDDSPFRQGRFIAGTDVPIKAFAGERADCAVILAWNYAEDILGRTQGSFRTVVTLLPDLRVW
jgi:SAM-dependent methyltransferase